MRIDPATRSELARLRRLAGFRTQGQLARAVGLDDAKLSLVLHRTRRLRADEASRLAAALALPLPRLLHLLGITEQPPDADGHGRA